MAQDVQVVTRTNYVNKITYPNGVKRVEVLQQIWKSTPPLTATNAAELEVILNKLATNKIYTASFISVIGGTNNAPTYQVQLRKR